MSRTQFIALGIVALALAVLAAVLGLQNRWQYQPKSNQRFFPELEGRLNDVSRLQVQIAGFDPVTVERQGERWGVAERDGYPADLGLLRRELLALAQLQRVESMTRNPEKYDRLGLQALDVKGSEAREIRLWAGDQPLVQMLAGKSGPGGGTYVRLKDDPQSWLGSAAVNSPSQPADWLDKELFSLTPNQIYRISVQPAEGAAYTLSKADLKAAAFNLDTVPQGKRAKAMEVQRLGGALNALRLEDVVADSKGPESTVPWSKAQFEAFDGLLIEAQTRAVEDKHYLKLSARFDEALAKRFQEAASAPGQDAGMPAPVLESPDQVKATAAQLAERFKGWIFIVPGFKAELFTLAQDKLLEDQPQAAVPQQTTPPAPPAAIPEPGTAEPAPESATPGQPEQPAPAGPDESPAEQPAPPAEPPAEPTPPASETEPPATTPERPPTSERQPAAVSEPPAAEASPPVPPETVPAVEAPAAAPESSVPPEATPVTPVVEEPPAPPQAPESAEPPPPATEPGEPTKQPAPPGGQ